MGEFNHYWPVYKNLEEETLELAKYIQFNDDQLKVYSMHIADLLVRCAMEIEALSKELYWNNGGTKKYDENGKERDLYFDTDCIAHLDDLWSICSKKIFVSSSKFYFDEEDNRILSPLKKARKRGGVKWNKAYQAVKHDRKKSLQSGNILNLINALGALYILNVYYMDRRINLGVTMTPEQEFDNRLGSEIFAVSFTDVTIKVELGGSGKDDSLSDEVKEKLVESIYILKYTASSWTNVNNALNNDNEKLRRELIESNEFIQFVRENPNEIEKETHLLSLVSKVLGNDYLSKHNSMGHFNAAFMKAQKEAIVYKNGIIYG